MESGKHDAQRRSWNQEHSSPRILFPMDKTSPSSGVVEYWEWLKKHSRHSGTVKGIEMGCGKGRNSIWLATQGAEVQAFDFSDVAISIARERSSGNVRFEVHDATTQWPYSDESFDVGVDCFASSDIEDYTGRAFARDEFRRVLKKNGHLFVFAIAATSPFHRMMLRKSPGPEYNSFLHPGGKFEKVYDQDELQNFYSGFHSIEIRLVKKGTAKFYGREYGCENYWMILEKA